MIMQHSYLPVSLLFLLIFVYQQQQSAFAFAPQQQKRILYSSNTALNALSDREREIRRKINALKKQGMIKKEGSEDNTEKDDDDYRARVVQKLGSAKSKMLGFSGDAQLEEDEEEEEEDDRLSMDTRVQIGQRTDMPPVQVEPTTMPSSPSFSRKTVINPDLFGDVPKQDDSRLEDDDYLEEVARKLALKKAEKKREREAQENIRLAEVRRKREETYQSATTATDDTEGTSKAPKKLTSGIGGSWDKNETAANADMYKPKSGSWGQFPRPRDISKAYGGGRRVGPGYSDEAARLKSTEETRARLQRYREKVGIEVESEKVHAKEIEEALNIAGLAMQRGIYTTAVSALEKVTKYCSTNSKVGGKVFLELAMAYEAAGRAQEAITIYTTLTKCRIEEIKINAKKLLYGIEAMQFMRDDMRSSEFSRNQAKNVFIDTTGLDNIASHFDDVYNTAYIDMDTGFYKRLTESVVRSPREARQILLRATGPGEESRLRIVQALRSLSRRFDEALQTEMTRNAPVPESVAVMDGKPIVQVVEEDTTCIDIGGFVLMDASQMKENLSGEWRLQLLADKRGDGVKYYNTTVSWQTIDTESMTFSAETPSAFITVQQAGNVEFNEKRRILRRRSVEVSGGGVLAGLFGTTTGAAGAVRTPQQVVSVDSVLLITRCVPSQRQSNKEDEKDYFALWRKVDRGTFSNQYQ